MKKNKCIDCKTRLIRYGTIGLCCPKFGCSMFKKSVEEVGVQ